MTRQSSFKRLVRARMEKTGESYTAARASLLTPEEPQASAAPVLATSDEAIRERTGRGWEEWFDALDHDPRCARRLGGRGDRRPIGFPVAGDHVLPRTVRLAAHVLGMHERAAARELAEHRDRVQAGDQQPADIRLLRHPRRGDATPQVTAVVEDPELEVVVVVREAEPGARRDLRRGDDPRDRRVRRRRGLRRGH